MESEVSEGSACRRVAPKWPRLGERGGEPAQGLLPMRRRLPPGIQAARDVWQHAVLEGGRCGANSFGGRLRRRVQRARLGFQGVGRGSQVVRGRAQGVGGGSQPLVGGPGFRRELGRWPGAGRSGLGGEVADERLVVASNPSAVAGRIEWLPGRCDIAAHGAEARWACAAALDNCSAPSVAFLESAVPYSFTVLRAFASSSFDCPMAPADVAHRLEAPPTCRQRERRTSAYRPRCRRALPRSRGFR